MPAQIPASSPRHKIHGVANAFTTTSGVPSSFKFSYGTWECGADASLTNYGIINSYQLASLNDAENLKDGGGSTFAHAFKDPGWKVTGTLLLERQLEGNDTTPQVGGVITFADKIFDNEGNLARAVVTSITAKWEKEGWTMFDFEAEARDSMNLDDSFGVSINETSGVESVIYSA